MELKSSLIYIGKFQGLKLRAFGIDQLLDVTTEIKIVHVRLRPQLWLARPNLHRNHHCWEGRSAREVMELVQADYVRCVEPWAPYQYGRWQAGRETTSQLVPITLRRLA